MEDLDITKVVLDAPTTILGTEITLDDIKRKIADLATTNDGEPLKAAMVDLKKALRANPEACNLLMPEEIGAMVAKIYKLTNTAVLTQKAKDTTKVAKKIDLKSIKDMPSDF